MNAELEKELQRLATCNACACAADVPERKRFKLARDIGALEKKLECELAPAELRRTCDEWERASLPFLDWGDDSHFEKFLAELTKVRVPTGEGDTINKALEAVLKISVSELPIIPAMEKADEGRRRLFALHRELARLSTSGK